MSDTHKKIPRHRKPKGRGNPLGVCQCENCRAGRLKGSKKFIDKIKHKFRNEWRSNKPFKKGIYTD